MKIILILPALAGLSACASVVEGTTQNILVNTNPTDAECGFYREGLRIATVVSTPGSALVSKTKHDIWILCTKKGYAQAAYYNHSGIAGGTFGDIVMGGGVGWAIDSASGADNKYDGMVNLNLLPLPATASSDTALPPTFSGAASPSAVAAVPPPSPAPVAAATAPPAATVAPAASPPALPAAAAAPPAPAVAPPPVAAVQPPPAPPTILSASQAATAAAAANEATSPHFIQLPSVPGPSVPGPSAQAAPVKPVTTVATGTGS